MSGPQEPISVYIGQRHIGDVVPKGERFEAVKACGESLGLFNSGTAAADAIHAARKG